MSSNTVAHQPRAVKVACYWRQRNARVEVYRTDGSTRFYLLSANGPSFRRLCRATGCRPWARIYASAGWSALRPEAMY